MRRLDGSSSLWLSISNGGMRSHLRFNRSGREILEQNRVDETRLEQTRSDQIRAEKSRSKISGQPPPPALGKLGGRSWFSYLPRSAGSCHQINLLLT